MVNIGVWEGGSGGKYHRERKGSFPLIEESMACKMWPEPKEKSGG